MKIPERFRLKNSVKYPTSLLIGGLNKLGVEIAESLIEQGGYVIVIDQYHGNKISLLNSFSDKDLISFVDFTEIPSLDQEVRRLDYVFFFAHENDNLEEKVSTQEFLNFSNYLDATLLITQKFDAKFLLTTSIKAHQQILHSQQIDFNYGTESVSRHIVYTKMEKQRYAESLVLEYVADHNLDARILRLGEIIGEGMDFSEKTPFVELILQAVNSSTLKLKKDGLESEWLVHSLDVAYGIIKAMFSKATKGKIYSIAYENQYTHLAIAYQIQDIEDGAQEIQFSVESDNLPELKLYKPAPNLSRIGWMPRVTFEKAVKESLALAKIFVLEQKQSDTFQKKLKTFLSFGGALKSQEKEPINRLIEERKQDELLKKQKIEFINLNIKEKKKRKPRTLREKVQNIVWGYLIDLGSTFKFLKNRTPLEFGIILFSVFFLIFFYFYVFAPSLLLLKNYLNVVPEIQSIEESLKEHRYDDLQEKTMIVKNSISDSSKILNNYTSFGKILGLSQHLNSTIAYLSSVETFLSGVENIAYVLEPLKLYFDSYSNNLLLRRSVDTFLTTITAGYDYSEILKIITQRAPFLELGNSKIQRAVRSLDNIDFDKVPDFLINTFWGQVELQNELPETFKLIEGVRFIPELLNQKTYLILLLDNSRPMPIGGDISAFAMLSTKNGSVSDVIVQSMEDVNFNLGNVTEQTLKEINKRRFTYKNTSNLTVYDFASIDDFSIFSREISSVFENTFNRNISGVLAIDLNSLEDLLKIFNNQVEINSISFNNGDILNNIKLSQLSNESIYNKKRILGQILGNVIFELSNDLKNLYPEISRAIFDGFKNYQVRFDVFTSTYNQFQNENNIKTNIQADFFEKTAIITEDPKFVNAERYSSLNLSKNFIITNRLNILGSMGVNFQNFGSTQEVSTCFPNSVLVNSIKVIGIAPERVTINATQREHCVVAKIIAENEFQINWETTSLKDSDLNSQSLKFLLSKNPGAKTSLDLKITLEDNWKFGKIEPKLNVINNSIIFTSTLESSKVLDIDLIK